MADERPAAFGRLCVETSVVRELNQRKYPAAFGRLCVETTMKGFEKGAWLPAAFGRLCVETCSGIRLPAATCQPPSGGCVLKLFVLNLPFLDFGQPPSGGCVLKPQMVGGGSGLFSSRLRAAVC